MKKFLQLFLVVVALLMGFPQCVKAQGICKKISILPHEHDSSYVSWVNKKAFNQKELDYLFRKAEYEINRQPLYIDLQMEIRPMRKITPIQDFGYYDFTLNTGQLLSFSRYLYFTVPKMIDTTVDYHLVFLPSSKVTEAHVVTNPQLAPTMCKVVKPFKDGYNLIYVILNDSFSLDFYAALIARTIIGSFGAKIPVGEVGTLLSEDMYQIGDSLSSASIMQINAAMALASNSGCLETGTGCRTIKPAVIVGVDPTVIEKTNVMIYDRKIINHDLKFITVYDLLGRPIVRSSERMIDLHKIPPGIFLIQEDQKIPIKHFFYGSFYFDTKNVKPPFCKGAFFIDLKKSVI